MDFCSRDDGADEVVVIRVGHRVEVRVVALSPRKRATGEAVERTTVLSLERSGLRTVCSDVVSILVSDVHHVDTRVEFTADAAHGVDHRLRSNVVDVLIAFAEVLPDVEGLSVGIDFNSIVVAGNQVARDTFLDGCLAHCSQVALCCHVNGEAQTKRVGVCCPLVEVALVDVVVAGEEGLGGRVGRAFQSEDVVVEFAQTINHGAIEFHVVVEGGTSVVDATRHTQSSGCGEGNVSENIHDLRKVVIDEHLGAILEDAILCLVVAVLAVVNAFQLTELRQCAVECIPTVVGIGVGNIVHASRFVLVSDGLCKATKSVVPGVHSPILVVSIVDSVCEVVGIAIVVECTGHQRCAVCLRCL